MCTTCGRESNRAAAHPSSIRDNPSLRYCAPQTTKIRISGSNYCSASHPTRGTTVGRRRERETYGFVGRNGEAIEDAAAAAAHRAGDKGRPRGGGAKIWAKSGSGVGTPCRTCNKIKKQLASACSGGASIQWTATVEDGGPQRQRVKPGSGGEPKAAAEGGAARASEGAEEEGPQPGGGSEKAHSRGGSHRSRNRVGPAFQPSRVKQK